MTTNLNKDSIETLFVRIAGEDDLSAFQQLFDDFFPPLCLFAMRYIASQETCEDLVQDVFFKVWKERKHLAVHTSPRNYLVTLVRNRCVDYLRRRHVEMRYRETELSKPIGTAAEEIYSVTECEQMIRSALDKLPENIRGVFEMNRFSDKTYVEIAAESGISVKTVESYISKALKTLRKEMKDYLASVLL